MIRHGKNGQRNNYDLPPGIYECGGNEGSLSNEQDAKAVPNRDHVEVAKRVRCDGDRGPDVDPIHHSYTDQTITDNNRPAAKAAADDFSVNEQNDRRIDENVQALQRLAIGNPKRSKIAAHPLATKKLIERAVSKVDRTTCGTGLIIKVIESALDSEFQTRQDRYKHRERVIQESNSIDRQIAERERMQNDKINKLKFVENLPDKEILVLWVEYLRNSSEYTLRNATSLVDEGHDRRKIWSFVSYVYNHYKNNKVARCDSSESIVDAPSPL